MTVKKGVEFLLKIEDPNDSSAYITVAALQSVSVSYSNSIPIVSDLLQETQEQNAGDAQYFRSTTVSANGFATSDASRTELIAKIESGESFNVRLDMDTGPIGDTILATARLESLSFDGGHTGAQSMSVTMRLFEPDHDVVDYVAWNSADKHSNVTLSNDDFTMTSADSNGSGTVRATTGYSTGRYYWEIDAANVVGNFFIGLASTYVTLDNDIYPGYDPNSYPDSGGPGYSFASNFVVYGVDSNTGTSQSGNVNNSGSGNTYGLAVDFDNSVVEVYRTGADTSPSIIFGIAAFFTYYPSAYVASTGGTTVTLNAGQNDFSIGAPANYTAGLYAPAPSQSSINTDTANETTYTIWDKFSRPSLLALYGDGLTIAGIQNQNGAIKSKASKSSGKWYCEFTFTNVDNNIAFKVGFVESTWSTSNLFGLNGSGSDGNLACDTDSVEYYLNGGSHSGSPSHYLATTTCRCISMKLDLDVGSVLFRDETNNSDIGSAITIPTGITVHIAAIMEADHGQKCTLNAGQNAWVGSLPSGYSGWTK